MATDHRQEEPCSEERKENEKERTVRDNINSTEEGAGKSTERSLDEFNKV